MAESKKQLSARSSRIIGTLILILSAVALAFSGDRIFKGMQMRSEWSKAVATVTNLEPVRGSKGRVKYAAWFAFRDEATNRSYRVRSHMISNPPAFRRGQRVEMLYPADHPEDAVANRFMEVYFWAMALGLIGIVLAVFGFALRKTRDDAEGDH